MTEKKTTNIVPYDVRKASVRKWEYVASRIRYHKDGSDDLGMLFRVECLGACSYCNHYKPLAHNTCMVCPLYRAKVCSEERDPDVLFWQIDEPAAIANPKRFTALVNRMIRCVRAGRLVR